MTGCRSSGAHDHRHASLKRYIGSGYNLQVMNRYDEVLVKHRKAFVAAAKRSKARSIALVGSVARQEDTAESDYDFLVDFKKGVTLFDIGGLQADLEDLLGCSVDVVPRSCVRETCREMFEDAVQL